MSWRGFFGYVVAIVVGSPPSAITGTVGRTVVRSCLGAGTAGTVGVEGGGPPRAGTEVSSLGECSGELSGATMSGSGGGAGRAPLGIATETDERLDA